MLELLWLLLPVAALSGWYAGRREQHTEGGTGALRSGYFQGLNYLLNEQPDKAIEVFTRMVELDSDTVETHLALGSLFRRRGEVDRAIRIHQHLIARPSLSREQRAHALLELGEDYMRAGLLDRAESLFEQVVESGVRADAALRQLLVIYQQEKEWERAIATALRLDGRSVKGVRPQIAQFHCELADQARSARDWGQVRLQVKRALSHDPNCVRASILQGDAERAQGNFKAALKAYIRVKHQDIDFLPEVLEPLRDCYTRLQQLDGMLRFLQDSIHEYRGVAPVLMLAELVRERDGADAAASFLTEQLRRSPSVRGLAHLVALTNRAAGSGEVSTLEGLFSGLLRDRPNYECRQCGFAAKSLYWQCPSCRSWSTVKPVWGMRGE